MTRLILDLLSDLLLVAYPIAQAIIAFRKGKKQKAGAWAYASGCALIALGYHIAIAHHGTISFHLATK
jgi:hypothetical protein